MAVVTNAFGWKQGLAARDHAFSSKIQPANLLSLSVYGVILRGSSICGVRTQSCCGRRTLRNRRRRGQWIRMNDRIKETRIHLNESTPAPHNTDFEFPRVPTSQNTGSLVHC